MCIRDRDHTEAKIWVDHLDPRTTVAEVNVIKINFKATIMEIITTQVFINTIKDSSKIHAEDITKVMDTANLAAEAVDVPEEVFHKCGCSRGNFRGQSNYQYQQYYAHDDNDQTVEQYGPPCTLCRRYNHSPKHCYKGEHDINDIMEKMSINTHQPQQSGLY